MSSLELDRGHHAKAGVPALTVVPNLEILEDRVRQLDSCPPALTIEKFDRKVDVERWAKSEEVAQLTGTWIDPRNGQITFGAWTET